MQKNINSQAQKKRRKDAIISTVSFTVILLLSAIGVLILRSYYQIDGFWGTVMIILAVSDLMMIIPGWTSLKKRLIEIEGGEEDAASEY